MGTSPPRLLASSLLACSLILSFAAPASAQQRQQIAGDGIAAGARFDPKTEAAAAERGAVLFRPSCGFCHGAEARGAQGSDLTQSAAINADSDGQALAALLKVGRPEAGMPPFADLSAREVADINAFVRSKAVEQRKPMDLAKMVVGDPAAGKAYFDGPGKCSTCHSADGEFKGIGARMSPLTLQGRMVNPRAVGRGQGAAGPPPVRARATVTLDDGEVVAGEVVQVNDFFITLSGPNGSRTIARDNEKPRVVISDPLEAHRQQMMKWTDKAMHDVTAYLVSLK